MRSENEKKETTYILCIYVHIIYSIAAGGLNSSVYDQSQTWSTNSTLSGASGAFDGTAEGSSGAANYSNSGNVLFSPSVTINSKLEIYTNRTHSGCNSFVF